MATYLVEKEVDLANVIVEQFIITPGTKTANALRKELNALKNSINYQNFTYREDEFWKAIKRLIKGEIDGYELELVSVTKKSLNAFANAGSDVGFVLINKRLAQVSEKKRQRQLNLEELPPLTTKEKSDLDDDTSAKETPEDTTAKPLEETKLSKQEKKESSREKIPTNPLWADAIAISTSEGIEENKQNSPSEKIVGPEGETKDNRPPDHVPFFTGPVDKI